MENKYYIHGINGPVIDVRGGKGLSMLDMVYVSDLRLPGEVVSVGKDSAAAKAGIKAGDVITSVNGTSVEDAADVRRALRRVDEGKEFPIEVTRDRKTLSLKAKIEPAAHERPGTRTAVF
jgi:S1-C subfamily serine protease